MVGLMFDTHACTAEVLLDSGEPLEAALRHARAAIELDVEEASVNFASRPTVPIFQGEPWR